MWYFVFSVRGRNWETIGFLGHFSVLNSSILCVSTSFMPVVLLGVEERSQQSTRLGTSEWLDCVSASQPQAGQLWEKQAAAWFSPQSRHGFLHLHHKCDWGPHLCVPHSTGEMLLCTVYTGLSDDGEGKNHQASICLPQHSVCFKMVFLDLSGGKPLSKQPSSSSPSSL